MKLILEQLREGRDVLPVAETCQVVDHGERREMALDGELTVDNTGSRVLVHGSLHAHGRSVCDRCLAECDQDYGVEVAIVILRAGEGREAPEGEEWVIRQRSGVVDLAEPLREATALGLPLRTLCRDDCRGLCPHCGADLNDGPCGCDEPVADPRWDALP